MRSVRGIMMLAAVCCLCSGVAHGQGKPAPAAVTGSWKVVSVSADGKPVAMQTRRHKITFTLFRAYGWAMTVLERNRVRAARGQFRPAAQPGRYVLAVKTASGPVDVARMSLSPKGGAVFTWVAPRPPVKGENAALKRAGVVSRFGAKLGRFAGAHARLRLHARRAK